jgi:flagellar basal-body rod protein FlgF
MNVSVTQAAAAMNANSRWQEMISENLAAGSVPGYRRQDMSFQAVQAGVMGVGDKATSASQKALLMPKAIASTAFSSGAMNPTGAQTDVALDGPGFFQIRQADGSTAYTRSGAFKLNAQGELMTANGLTVMGESGPIQKDTNNPAPLSISSDGTVSQGLDVKGQLKIVDFSDPQKLQYIGSGLFVAKGTDAVPITPVNTTVRQGFLESSNASTTHEMANLITSMRAFEANQKVIQASDDRMSRVISELGSTS